MPADPANEFDLTYANEQLRRSRHPLRKLIKSLYLNQVLQDVQGRAIDFGCGAGQLLERLPPGSIGIEINPVLVAQLQAAGKNVVAYDATTDDFALSGFAAGGFYRTLVISHVLEHFANSAQVIGKIWKACARLGVETIIAIVPGEKGFASDATHKTFISEDYLASRGLNVVEGFAIEKVRYFPGDIRAWGKYLTFHELKIVYKRIH
jgi:SAM-dependent methyltransferase